MRIWPMILGLLAAGTTISTAAENLVENPSAELPGQDGKTPKNWAMYSGAGSARVSIAIGEAHSGRASACLTLEKWYTPKGAPDTPANHSISMGMVLADNTGYGAKGALPAIPGTSYVYSFWHKGTVPSARVQVTAWPSAGADDTQRIHVAVAGTPLEPRADWHRATGTFRIPDDADRFVLKVVAVGDETKGYRLGKLYVDDALVAAKRFPDGELRAAWCDPVSEANRDKGLAQIEALLDKAQSGGFNSLFLWTPSLYAAALDRPALQAKCPAARWDAFGATLRAAAKRKMQVHAWFSPWIYKASQAVELLDHPEWAAVSAAGKIDKDGVCLVRPEVRQFELDLIARLADRYPDLAGIHIEEPGFNWGADYCYCKHCQDLCRRWLGLEILKHPVAVRTSLHNLAAFMCTDFITRLRTMLTDRRPEMWLSANGGGGRNTDWYIGRDWTTWARRGLIDFYVPQLYTRQVDDFLRRARETKSCLGECDLVTGMAVSWSGIYPARQDPQTIRAEIAAARSLGAKGFVVFNLGHVYPEHLAAIRQAAQQRPAKESKP